MENERPYWIFKTLTHLKLCLATATHNYKSVKITCICYNIVAQLFYNLEFSKHKSYITVFEKFYSIFNVKDNIDDIRIQRA